MAREIALIICGLIIVTILTVIGLWIDWLIGTKFVCSIFTFAGFVIMLLMFRYHKEM